ncbi:MAG: hypothetical protein J2P19_00130 [Pseudonocardia sp.]|nr:hypothetical protein [Pseudonocardia sp.]
MNVSEANAINAVLDFFLGSTDASETTYRVDRRIAEQQAAWLADRANARLGAGLTGDCVRDVWQRTIFLREDREHTNRNTVRYIAEHALVTNDPVAHQQYAAPLQEWVDAAPDADHRDARSRALWSAYTARSLHERRNVTAVQLICEAAPHYARIVGAVDEDADALWKTTEAAQTNT